MIDFIKKHIENIVFVLFIIFFIIGLKYIIFMYLSLLFIMLYLTNQSGKEGFILFFSVVVLGVITALVPRYFGDIGKYAIIVFVIFYIIFILYKRYKNSKSLWYWEDEDNH